LTQGQNRKAREIVGAAAASVVFSCLVGACCSSSKAKTFDDKEFWDTGFKVLLGGDFCFGDTYKEGKAALKKNGYDYPFEKIAPFLNAADFSVVNLETPITDVDFEPYKGSKKWVHRGEVAVYPKYMKKYRINAVSLANNHSMDCGVEGLLQTIKILDDNAVSRFGAGVDSDEAGKPLTKDIAIGKKHFELAVFAAYEHRKKKDDKEYSSRFASPDAPGVNPLSPKDMGDSIGKYRKNHTDAFIIVFPHWGSNYAWKSKDQTKIGEELIDSGADIVVGHGAHLMQEIEKHKDKWIVYSLGNFMFNSPGRYQKKDRWPYSEISVLRFSFDNAKLNCRLRLYPVVSDNLLTNYQTRPVDEKDFDKAVDLLKDQSDRSDIFSSDLAMGKDKLGFYLEAVVLK
jgi:poly-gamma-glutamate capsule biosynthesis protein CapA/YwtB (metallophosphatase superfamily)